jgi:hypothetical protein
MFVVRLIRSNIHGKWAELQKDLLCELTVNGLILREQDSSNMLGDFPRSSINQFSRLTGVLILVNCAETSIVLKFALQEEALTFVGRIVDLLFSFKDDFALQQNGEEAVTGFTVPNLSDRRVQGFILKLLFSDEFKEYVGELRSLLRSMESNIATSD